DRLGPIVIQAKTSPILSDERRWEKWRQLRPDRDRAGSGSAGSVRPSERFVDIVMHHVHAKISRPGNAKDGIHICAIEVDERSVTVKKLRNSGNLVVENPKGVGVRDHENCRALIEFCSEIVQIDDTTAIALDADRIEASDRRAGRIRAMRTIGNEHPR